MADRSRNREPVSLDALLSRNMQQFDRLFDHQMTGGRAARAPEPVVDAPVVAEPSVDSAPPAAGGDETIIADLNRRFATDWAAEIVSQRIDGGAAHVTCRLTAGADTADADGTARVRADGEQAALDRAYHRALKSCADRLRTGHATEPGRPAPAPMADVLTANRVEAALLGSIAEMEAVVRHRLPPSATGASTGPSCMVMDSSGRMIAGEAGAFLAHLLSEHPMTLGAGDVLLLGDPYATHGAVSRAGEWIAVAPVVAGADLIGHVAVRLSVADVGGAVPGSVPADARDVFAEGLRVPPVRIVEGGVFNAAALDIILGNARTPEANRLALGAMIAGCEAGAQRMQALVARLGPQVFHGGAAALLNRTHDAIRSLIVSRIPEEPQSFEDQIDDDGLGNGPFRLRLSVWREGDHAYFDWTGTAAEAAGPVNLHLHVGAAKSLIGRALMAQAGAPGPFNEGFYDLIHVSVPSGSLLRPATRAGLGHGRHAAARHDDVLGAAMKRHMPIHLIAAPGGDVAIRFDGDGFHGQDRVPGGGGACHGQDGTEGDCAPAEALERDYPVVVERSCAIPGSGGAGQFRGGHGWERAYRFHAPAVIALQADRHLSRPWGAAGGGAGTLAEAWVERGDGATETLPAKCHGVQVSTGDRVVVRSAAGGGHGEAFARDSDAVRRDVLAGLLTAQDATADYGVALAGPGREVDQRATSELRSGQLLARATMKVFDRGDQA